MKNNDKTFPEATCEVRAHVPVLLSRLPNHPCCRDCFPITRPLLITRQFLFVYSFVGLISSARLSKGCMVSGKENDVLKGNVVFHPYKERL